MTKLNQIKLLPHETINEISKTGDYANHYPYAVTWEETAFFLPHLTDSYRNGFIVRRSLACGLRRGDCPLLRTQRRPTV